MSEIGIVRWLDPCVLAAHPRTCCMEPGARESLTGPHRFLCVDAGISWSTWTPLMSKNTFYRVEVPQSIRRCDHTMRGLYWMTGTFYANPENLWTVSNWVVEHAARSIQRRNWGGARDRGPEGADLDAGMTDLKRDNNRLRAALLRYGQHDLDCDAAAVFMKRPCTCGFDAAKEEHDGQDDAGSDRG